MLSIYIRTLCFIVFVGCFKVIQIDVIFFFVIFVFSMLYCYLLLVFLQVILGLSVFCIDAVFGILVLFIFQSIFFVACLILDQKRIVVRRDVILCCLVYKSFEFNKCSQKNFLVLVFENYIGLFLMKILFKVCIRLLEILLRKKIILKFIC